jgi:hypothetical protein
MIKVLRHHLKEKPSLYERKAKMPKSKLKYTKANTICSNKELRKGEVSINIVNSKPSRAKLKKALLTCKRKSKHPN